jgi:hypothetical protein
LCPICKEWVILPNVNAKVKDPLRALWILI